MIPELIVIDTLKGILDLRQYLTKFDYVAFDTETTGLTQRDQVIGYSICTEEAKAYYVILMKYRTNSNTLEAVSGTEYQAEAFRVLQDLQTKNLVAHNSIFDCMMIEANFKIWLIDHIHTDTMILAHLLDENRRVGLKELGAKYFGLDTNSESKEMKASVIANGGVLTKALWEGYKADPYLMGKYGARDAWLTYKLFLELLPELEEQGLTKFFYEDESMPLLRGPTYELNTTGIQVDMDELNKLKNTLKAECAEAKAFIYKEIEPHIKERYPGTNAKNSFNIGSSKQLAWLLFGKLGLEFGNLTKGGKTVCKQLTGRLPYTFSARKDFISICLNRVGEIVQPSAIINGKKTNAKKLKQPWDYIAVDKDALKKIAPKLKWVEKLLEYQRKKKTLNTYVEGIESRVQYGIIRPSYLQHGTLTGRYASRNPNLQNLPRDDQRVKNCFIARPGKVFVSADQSQLEPRTFASYSKEPKLMAAFDGTTDFYSVVGMEVFDVYDCTPQKEGSASAFGVKYKKLRDGAKIYALATAYGATPNQLVKTSGKSVDDTREDMEKYFERFPGVQTMMLEAHELAKKQGFVTNLFGRIRRLPDAKKLTKMYGKTKHWGLPYDARKLLNMACNFRIQSTGASIVNRSAIAFHEACKQANIDCKLVSQIHDELVVECNTSDADMVALLLQNAMENTVELPGVKLEAIPRITKTLSK